MKKSLLYGLILSGILFAACSEQKPDENGHDLWLRSQGTQPVEIICDQTSATLEIACRELKENWQGKAGDTLRLSLIKDDAISGDGYRLDCRQIQACTEYGILYGVYDILRRQRCGKDILEAEISLPAYDRRILNHWDNLNGRSERGYAGVSLFWEGDLSVSEDDQILWTEYARANASIGLNGSVLNNVNASPRMLSTEVLERVKTIADVLRPYGIKVYLSVNFSSPMVLGGLPTADPLNKEVIRWWRNKMQEIYRYIPDFGGFLVKASSEGQPGPQDFGRTHADGANMLAKALEPYHGVVFWRAFVYGPNDPDRAKQAYLEFVPLDGKFADNVYIQIKNGPVDFQPREPFSPLFGALPQTKTMIEFQITKEYLGHANSLAYLAPMWKECLDADTYAEGEGSTVAAVTDGCLYHRNESAIAGVANTGRDSNWCGSHFDQANWYAFGRLAWQPDLSSEEIAREWLTQTFCDEPSFLETASRLMMDSREDVVHYMMPLGLHHIFAGNHHYGPEPWYAPAGTRKDWTPPYYHQASCDGIGFDRTVASGSGATAQYHSPLFETFENAGSCPDEYLLWFHHLPWDFKMKNGNDLWDELCRAYQKGVDATASYASRWESLRPYIDARRHEEIAVKMQRQAQDAVWWKDACLLYFQTFSKRPFPEDVAPAVYSLEALQSYHLNLSIYGNAPLKKLPLPEKSSE